MFFRGVSSTGGGSMWIDRGNLVAADYSNANLTYDGAVRDLDLSAIVGTGKKLVLIRCWAYDIVPTATIMFRTKGITGTWNTANFHGVADVNDQDWNFWVVTDADGVIQYQSYISGVANWHLAIRGWMDAA